jgi:hypothetical protein
MEPIIKISSSRFEQFRSRDEEHERVRKSQLQSYISDLSEKSAFDEAQLEDDLEPVIVRSFMDDVPGKQRSCTRVLSACLNNIFENPEGRLSTGQRLFIILYSLFEIYRVVISSYLIVFVPQSCGGYSCTILQNIQPNDDLEVAALTFNTFMAFYFVVLFSIEFAREKKIRQYMIADKSSSTDKDYLIRTLSNMKPESREDILWLNNVYRFHSHTLLVVFCVNMGISCTVIYKNYLNNTTFTVFTTNALFMINRIHKALKITSSGEYNIYSAYRTDSILYNRDKETWLDKEMKASDVGICV